MGRGGRRGSPQAELPLQGDLKRQRQGRSPAPRGTRAPAVPARSPESAARSPGEDSRRSRAASSGGEDGAADLAKKLAPRGRHVKKCMMCKVGGQNMQFHATNACASCYDIWRDHLSQHGSFDDVATKVAKKLDGMEDRWKACVQHREGNGQATSSTEVSEGSTITWRSSKHCIGLTRQQFKDRAAKM